MPTHPHLQRLASGPRPVGSTANAEAREYCAEYLRSLGFEVAERPFEFSALPGKYAAQIIGAVACLGFGASIATSGTGLSRITAIVIIGLTVWLGRRNATRDRWLRQAGMNLEATRGPAPRVWLVAHIDSKSQPISSALRSVGVVALTLAVLSVFLFYLFPDVVDAVGMFGGLILVLAAVQSRSDGAADNASGVAAVLDAAALIAPNRSFGVLITDAEELALAGAVAWTGRRAKGIAVNCDTIDDGGRLVLFHYGYRSGEVDVHAGPIARSVDPRSRVMRPPPGVLTDSNAFHKAGWKTVTLARGTIRTLNRIHTRRDSLDSLRGTGIPDAARVLARLVEELA